MALIAARLGVNSSIQPILFNWKSVNGQWRVLRNGFRIIVIPQCFEYMFNGFHWFPCLLHMCELIHFSDCSECDTEIVMGLMDSCRKECVLADSQAGQKFWEMTNTVFMVHEQWMEAVASSFMYAPLGNVSVQPGSGGLTNDYSLFGSNSFGFIKWLELVQQ